MENVRPIFIYLAIVAVILGALGAIILVGKPTGKVISESADIEKYSLETIGQHNSEIDCWIVEEKIVYDISLFLRTWKDDRLIGECGTDIGNLGFFSFFSFLSCFFLCFFLFLFLLCFFFSSFFPCFLELGFF